MDRSARPTARRSPPAPIASSTARQLADSGIRDEKFQRDTYRVVGGARGTFNEDWNYEISANYGKFKEDTTTFGYLDRQRFMLSLDAGRQPGHRPDPVPLAVRSGDGQRRLPVPAVQERGRTAARLAADIAACVPYNPFGGQIYSAAARLLHLQCPSQGVADAVRRARLRRRRFRASCSNCPAARSASCSAANIARKRLATQNDDFVETGFTNAVIIGEFDPPTFTVKEAFGEIRIPIAEGHAVLRRADRQRRWPRVRVQHGSIGTVWTYNVGGEWAPVRDLRFRGNYGQAVRAPNVSETGFPAVPNFAPGFVDPCSSGNIGASQPRPTARAATWLRRDDLGPALPSLVFGRTTSATSLPIYQRQQPGPRAGELGLARRSARCSSRAARASRQRRLVQDQGEGRDRLARRADDRQQLLRSAALTTCFCGLFARFAGRAPARSASSRVGSSRQLADLGGRQLRQLSRARASTRSRLSRQHR